MKGTRPLSIKEIQKVVNSFEGTYAIRNCSLFLLGISSGGRISELLALKVGDVWQNGQPVPEIHFNLHIVKGKETSRRVPLSRDGTKAIEDLIKWHRKEFRIAHAERPLFPSRNKRKGILAICPRSAQNALQAAFNKAGLTGNLASHSMRKSYAQRLYSQTADIYAVKEMLGHKSVNTTQDYLGVNYDKIMHASEAMSLHAYENEE